MRRLYARLKIAVDRPIPSTSVAHITTVQPGDFDRIRMLYRIYQLLLGSLRG
jgi:hypothetical protein